MHLVVLEQQYHVVWMPLGLVGLKWRFGDRQTGPCMGRCMGGCRWCMAWYVVWIWWGWTCGVGSGLDGDGVELVSGVSSVWKVVAPKGLCPFGPPTKIMNLFHTSLKQVVNLSRIYLYCGQNREFFIHIKNSLDRILSFGFLYFWTYGFYLFGRLVLI